MQVKTDKQKPLFSHILRSDIWSIKNCWHMFTLHKKMKFSIKDFLSKKDLENDFVFEEKKGF